MLVVGHGGQDVRPMCDAIDSHSVDRRYSDHGNNDRI